ncbi:MAG: hypothetical protein WAN65_31300 [Candidatus Sulfotelmatobacter sp.]
MNLFLRYIPLGLLAILLFLMLRNRAYRVCPWFFAYVAFGVCADVARFVTDGHPSAYYATYWITEAGYEIFGILVMYELLRLVLRNLARRWWARLILPAALVVGISLSLAHAHFAPPQSSGLRYYMFICQIAVRLVQALIFIGVVVAAVILRLRWRQYPLGIAAGFGGYSFVALLMTLKFYDFGTKFRFLFNLTSFVAYSLAVLVWIWFFSVPQKPDPELPAPTPEELEQYRNTLEQYLDWLRRMRWRCFR